MSAYSKRDEVADIAKENPGKAHRKAQGIDDPWRRAQALSWVARYTDEDPVAIAAQAAKAARECDDPYKQVAVRAWEVAALAERERVAEARSSLREASEDTKNVTPPSSRSEALLLLLQAALSISHEDAATVNTELRISCKPEDHWRCKRALLDGAKMLACELTPRPFFW